jgi:hypothetical protein
MRRRSKRFDWGRCAALLVVGTTACGGAPRYPTSTKLLEVPRRAPGVSIDPQFAAPTATGEEPRTLVLTPPVDSRAARRTVEQFLEAVVNEDPTTLSRLLAPGALQQVGVGGEVRSAGDYWQKRLARFDYAALRGEPLFRPEEVRLVRADAEPGLHGLRLEPRQVALSIPVITTHAGKMRLFGPSLTFVVTENGEQLTVTRIIEDFQLL